MPKKGPGKNLSRLNEDIRRELTDIIGEMKDPRLKDGLVTVTRVQTTSDLSQCKVYVSVLGGDAQELVKAFTAAKGYVRSAVAERMHIRKTPEFLFVADDGAAYAAHINQILKDL